MSVLVTHPKEVLGRSTVERALAAAVELDDAQLALGVGCLHKGDEVRVDVEVVRDGRLAGLRGGRVRRLEEVGLVEELCAVERWAVSTRRALGRQEHEGTLRWGIHWQEGYTRVTATPPTPPSPPLPRLAEAPRPTPPRRDLLMSS